MGEVKQLQNEIGLWHRGAFDWATSMDCLIKLLEETTEAMQAIKWGKGILAEELADCLICLLAAADRADIDLSEAVNIKLPRVKEKYGV